MGEGDSLGRRATAAQRSDEQRGDHQQRRRHRAGPAQLRRDPLGRRHPRPARRRRRVVVARNHVSRPTVAIARPVDLAALSPIRTSIAGARVRRTGNSPALVICRYLDMRTATILRWPRSPASTPESFDALVSDAARDRRADPPAAGRAAQPRRADRHRDHPGHRAEPAAHQPPPASCSSTPGSWTARPRARSSSTACPSAAGTADLVRRIAELVAARRRDRRRRPRGARARPPGPLAGRRRPTSTPTPTTGRRSARLYVAEADVERTCSTCSSARARSSGCSTSAPAPAGSSSCWPRTASAASASTSSHDMLAVARAHLADARVASASVRHGDLHRPPFEAASFDVAVMHHVLHLLDDPGAAIADARRLLRPGGPAAGRRLRPPRPRLPARRLRPPPPRHRRRRDGGRGPRAAGLEIETERSLLPAEHAIGERLTVRLWLLRARAARTAQTTTTAAGGRMTADTSISFEFFPPAHARRPRSGCGRSSSACGRSAPTFFSVTCGAGGSTREPTLATLRAPGRGVGPARRGPSDVRERHPRRGRRDDPRLLGRRRTPRRRAARGHARARRALRARTPTATRARPT